MDRYDLNHFRAFPVIPTQSSRRDKRIWWSTVSKAAVKSKSTSAAELPESIVGEQKVISILCYMPFVGNKGGQTFSVSFYKVFTHCCWYFGPFLHADLL